MAEFNPVVNRVWYGSPDDPVDELMGPGLSLRPEGKPIVGDELCDGHQMHYLWNGEKWE